MSKITSLTIVNQNGTSEYKVGCFYGCVLLDRVVDCTASSDNFHVPHFKGFTEDNELVFEAINAPVEVGYI